MDSEFPKHRDSDLTLTLNEANEKANLFLNYLRSTYRKIRQELLEDSDGEVRYPVIGVVIFGSCARQLLDPSTVYMHPLSDLDYFLVFDPTGLNEEDFRSLSRDFDNTIGSNVGYSSCFGTISLDPGKSVEGIGVDALYGLDDPNTKIYTVSFAD